MCHHSLTSRHRASDVLSSRRRQIKLVNINPSDIVEGRPAVVLGLVWTIILHFQVGCMNSDCGTRAARVCGQAKKGGESGWRRSRKPMLLYRQTNFVGDNIHFCHHVPAEQFCWRQHLYL